MSDSFSKLNAGRFGEVWASLARDYLAVMASSVSSERAFSSAGITITKRRNRLKGDVVEALQFLKCYYRQKYSKSSLDSPYVEQGAEGTEGEEGSDSVMENVDGIVFAATDDTDDVNMIDLPN